MHVVVLGPRDDAPPRSEWHRVLRGPLSVRIVAADLPSYATRAGVLPRVPDVKSLADALLEHADDGAEREARACECEDESAVGLE